MKVFDVVEAPSDKTFGYSVFAIQTGFLICALSVAEAIEEGNNIIGMVLTLH